MLFSLPLQLLLSVSPLTLVAISFRFFFWGFPSFAQTLMDTLQIFARFLFNLPLCHSMWQALWPNHQMLLWSERYRSDKPEKRLDGTRVLGTAAGAMNRELWTRCKLQKCRRDTKKIAITIWQSPKKTNEKNLQICWNFFGFFAFLHCKKFKLSAQNVQTAVNGFQWELERATTRHTLWKAGSVCQLLAGYL